MVDHNFFFLTKMFFLGLVTLKVSQVGCWLLVTYLGHFFIMLKKFMERDFLIYFLRKPEENRQKTGGEMKEKYLCVYSVASYVFIFISDLIRAKTLNTISYV